MDGVSAETQTVETAADLVSNDWVDFITTATLEATAGMPLTGGSNATTIDGEAHQAFLDKIEPYSVNALLLPGVGCNHACGSTSSSAAVSGMRSAASSSWPPGSPPRRTMRASSAFGIRSPTPEIADIPSHYLVYWVAGAEAGCAVNKSLTNFKYDGELTIDTNYSQAELEAALKAGKFMFHNVNGDVRVLEDINTLLTLSDTKGEIFQSNQTIRVCDQIANDTAVLFATKYLGTVPNDASGRASLWGDITKLIQNLNDIRAVENFDPEIVTCEQGDTKKAVLCIVNGLNVMNAMAQLYMSVIIQ
ncbi:MAG: phage tail sheath subtilisin-like domain-containing protein [Oscillospiraceae bacterium]